MIRDLLTRRDGAAARARWTLACEIADREIRAARGLAGQRNEPWVAKWLSVEVGQLASLQAMVTGKRLQPGTASFGLRRRGPVSSGLFYDMPLEFQEDAYQPLMNALEEVQRLYEGEVLPGWDWSRGFPPGWRASLGDRLRAYVP